MLREKLTLGSTRSGANLQAIFELFDSESGVSYDPGHCKGVDRIVSWDGDEMDSI